MEQITSEACAIGNYSSRDKEPY